jgi:hypothetical protein
MGGMNQYNGQPTFDAVLAGATSLNLGSPDRQGNGNEPCAVEKLCERALSPHYVGRMILARSPWPGAEGTSAL